MKIAYFDCYSGASGDMLLGCLLDAGLGLDDLRADLLNLPVGGYRLEAGSVTRRGISGTHLRVLDDSGVPLDAAGNAGHQSHHDQQPARTLSSIKNIVGRADLSDRVKERSLAVFGRIARAEAAVHGTTVDEVHFHEIGAVDSLVDVVGFCCGLERLDIEAVYCSPLTLGSGTIMTAHGRLPVPAPATLALLAEAEAPTRPGPAETELLTPTGAALLTEFATFEQPPMRVQAVGYGFGSKEFEWANALRMWLGADPSPAQAPDGDRVVLLACNLDDATGEMLGYAMERLLAAGALDVWFAPIQMKKNRPAVQLSVLARPEDEAALVRLVLAETPTLGVRRQRLDRAVAGREVRQVQTPWGSVRVKTKILDGEVVAVSPEYDDCARLAAGAGVPLVEVIRAVGEGQDVPG